MKSPRDRLVAVLNMEPGIDISYFNFCMEFEHYYNFDLSIDDYRPEEIKILENLFDVVVMYSPFEEERVRIPIYVGEKAVDRALKMARSHFLK